MEDTLTMVIAIFLAAVLMFIFPLMSISERNDDISQLAIQTATVQFVDNIRTTGKITLKDYDNYIQTLSATGNTYDVEMIARILDENPGKKGAQTETTKIGENIYYSEYTSQIEEQLYGANKQMKLKEGDIIEVNVRNTNTTIAQMLQNFFYSFSGNATYNIEASHSGVVMANGK